MPSTNLFEQPCLDGFRVTKALTPLTLGVVLLTLMGTPADAQSLTIQSPSSTTHVYGSPIPSPVPVVPGTNYPSSLSPYNSGNYNYGYSNYNYGYSNYNYGYGNYPSVSRPRRTVIRNSTLINPTVINSRITDSVLVDPVIINSPGYPRGVFQQPPVIYNPSGIDIRIGF